MDKDVEVSKDQNTIVVNGTCYKATTVNDNGERVSGCIGCDVVVNEESHDYCSHVPCSRLDRADRTDVVFKIQL